MKHRLKVSVCWQTPHCVVISHSSTTTVVVAEKKNSAFCWGGADGRAAEMLTRVWHSPLLCTGRNQHCRLQFCSLDVFARLVSGPLIALYCFPLTHLVVATAAAGCLTRPGITPGSGGCVCVLVCTLRGALVVVMMMAPWSQHTHTHRAASESRQRRMDSLRRHATCVLSVALLSPR